MEIKGIHEIYKLHATNSVAANPARAEEASFKAKSEQPKQDVISISPQGSFQTALQNEVKKYTAAQNNDVASSTRMALLKEKYQGDNCPVSGFEVASALLNRICGDPFAN